MTRLVWRKKTLFLHDFYVVRPLSWLSTIAQEANKVLQGGVSLPLLIGSVFKMLEMNQLKRSIGLSKKPSDIP